MTAFQGDGYNENQHPTDRKTAHCTALIPNTGSNVPNQVHFCAKSGQEEKSEPIQELITVTELRVLSSFWEKYPFT